MPIFPDAAPFALCAACFLLRAVPRLRLPDVYASDTYYHLLCARVIRENRFRLPERLPLAPLGHQHTYPFLYHYLLALFPLRQRLWLERFSGALFDTASLGVIYAFLAWLAGRGEAPAEPGAVLMVAALFACSPALLRLGSGPRAYNGSPRTLAQLLYLVHILAAYVALSESSGAALTVSVLAGAAAVLNAKFTTQVLLFFAPFFALAVSPWYLALAGAAVAAAVALSGGRGWRVLKGHYLHSAFYRNHLQRLFVQAAAPSLPEYAGRLRAAARDLLTGRNPAAALHWFFSEPHPLHLLLTVYTPFLALPLALAAEGSPGPAERFLLAWSVAALAWFAATKMKPLMYLGEGERYLEYATFPSLAIAVAWLWHAHSGWVWAFLVYSIVAAGWFLAAYHRRYAAVHAAHADIQRMFEWLERRPPGLVWPIGSLHWQTLYYSRFPVLTVGANIDPSRLPLEEFMLVAGRYPYPSAEFERILEQYRVRYIVSDGAHLRHYTSHILGAPGRFHSRVRTLFDTPALVLYEVMPSL